MAIYVKCKCGATHEVGDEYAGKVILCRECGREVPVLQPDEAVAKTDAIFDRDKFLLRQKHLAIRSEKYYVCDEEGNRLIYVERPYHLLSGLLGCSAGAAVGLFVLLVGIGVAGALHGSAWEAVAWLLAFGGAVVLGLITAVACFKKRHVLFYRDDSKQERLLDVLQHRKVHVLTATYTVRDAQENPLATLCKSYIYNIFRKLWRCYRPNGETLCVVWEDSLILSMLRRFLGPLFGALRTNFIFTDPDTGKVIGEFNRKFTILDRYVLDMTADHERKIDRRVAVAIAVMLDTGEKR